MGNLKTSHKIFAEEIIKHSNQTLAYITAFPESNHKTARIKAVQLLKRDDIKAYIEQRVHEINLTTNAIKQHALNTTLNNLVEETTSKLVGDVLTRHEKMMILANIARGTLLVPVTKKIKDVKTKRWNTITINEIPDHSARMKAVELHNRMSGDFAPEKVAHTDTKGNDIPFDPMQPLGTLEIIIANEFSKAGIK